ncbi:TraR/DksA family transcriptional regulator [Bailinhaonella thermotolerans]|nr:TraR/DksA C4-type zinc finger protein [Bailinhaonella thermotolerans]
MDTNQARGALLKLRAQALEQAARLDAEASALRDAIRTGEERVRGIDDPATATGAVADTDRISSVMKEKVAAIDAALARIDAGTYGLCVVCGKPIPEARLEFRPMAADHVECASRA